MSDAAGVTAPRPVTPASILAAQLQRLAALAEDADPVLRDGLREAAALAGGLDPYVAAYTTPESPALRRLAERTVAEDWDAHDGTPLEQEMLSGHVEGQALKTLVRLAGARRVLEVGMFTGYGALAMAEALPADGTVVALELEPTVAAFARSCFDESPDGAKIDVRVGPAQETLAALAAAGDVFDVVFVDADKAGYLGYFEAVLDGGLLAPGGLIAVDNTLMQGLPWGAGEPTPNGDAVAAFNRAIAADPRVEQVLLPLRDGLTLIQRA